MDCCAPQDWKVRYLSAAQKPGQRTFRTGNSCDVVRRTWHQGADVVRSTRTSRCRRMQDDRWPIERLSQFLGCKTLQIAREHYAFLNAEHLRAEMKWAARRAQCGVLATHQASP